MRQYTPVSLAVPAGTAQAAPVSTTWTVYPGYVWGFRIRIPPGHIGLTGVRLTYFGVPIIPFHPTQFLVGDDDTFEVPFEDQIENRGLLIQGYNTDIHPHTFYAWADVDPYLPSAGFATVSPRQASITAAPPLDLVGAMTSAIEVSHDQRNA